MKLYEGLESIETSFPRSTVAVGTFDGVHVGHQAIIRRAIQDARVYGRPALVFTFDRHPVELLAPERAPELITTPAQRNRLIADLGVDGLIVAHFDKAFSEQSPETFVRDVLKGKLGAESIVVGTTFGFGKGRAGNAFYLQSVQDDFNFTVHALEPVMVDGAPASSTRARTLLHAGNVAEAGRVLGHPFWLAGRVVEGQKLGHTLGYPTANLERTDRQVVPADGIYAVWAKLDDGRQLGGACSIGDRPTIANAGRAIETYLFDFNEDIYGREMELRFIGRLRKEQKFDSLTALKEQMARDIEQARALLATA
ncbi:MAG TPA: bifunctional riboflavin kinase/FAD synthetase [Chthonomonadaceae bacterium]|nr:bifunctional riboflavin kinase/FAD synthetase [Chthonomonadaceae bacterium]